MSGPAIEARRARSTTTWLAAAASAFHSRGGPAHDHHAENHGEHSRGITASNATDSDVMRPGYATPGRRRARRTVFPPGFCQSCTRRVRTMEARVQPRPTWARLTTAGGNESDLFGKVRYAGAPTAEAANSGLLMHYSETIFTPDSASTTAEFVPGALAAQWRPGNITLERSNPPPENLRSVSPSPGAQLVSRHLPPWARVFLSSSPGRKGPSSNGPLLLQTSFLHGWSGGITQEMSTREVLHV